MTWTQPRGSRTHCAGSKPCSQPIATVPSVHCVQHLHMSSIMTSPLSVALPGTWLHGPGHDLPKLTQRANLFRMAFASCTLSQICVDLLVDSIDVRLVKMGFPSDRSHADRAPARWLLAEGRVAVGRVEPDGEFVGNRRVAPGEWVDVTRARAAPWIEAAACDSDATLWAIPLDGLARCCSLDADFVHAMRHVVAERVCGLTEARHELATRNVLSRVAPWLCRHLQGLRAVAGMRGVPVRAREPPARAARLVHHPHPGFAQPAEIVSRLRRDGRRRIMMKASHGRTRSRA